MDWSESMIARSLATKFFNRKYLVVVPNCNYTGHECDLLCVTENLRIIDVEIKISRSDLKADAKKEKWWRRTEPWKTHGSYTLNRRCGPVSLEWPKKVWKHYYALPEEIWTDELIDALPSRSSGVILLKQHTSENGSLIDIGVVCRRKATPNKDATPIPEAAAVNIARLASLRMWDALARAGYGLN